MRFRAGWRGSGFYTNLQFYSEIDAKQGEGQGLH